jgi:hypothetical protein
MDVTAAMKPPLIRGVCALRAKNQSHQLPAKPEIAPDVRLCGSEENLAPKPRDKLASTHPSIRLSLGVSLSI